MNVQMGGWLAQALATDSPVLPVTAAMQVWLHLGWSMVLAWLAVSLIGRLLTGRARSVPGQWLLALGLALWAWMPGPGGPAYWLGLAFQAPSMGSVLLCALLLGCRMRGTGGRQKMFFSSGTAPSADGRSLGLAWMGVLLGWGLLLDSFALLPLQLYAWGFSPVALGMVVLLALLPWVTGGRIAHSGWWVGVVVPLVALVFVAWRLPTGNVWDAVLDPWLWLALQGWLIRRFWNRYKINS